MIKRVLIVDDNSTNLYMLESLIRGHGMEVTSAENGKIALDKAGLKPDIGKLSVPAEILSKPTKLTNVEFSLIKEHARKRYEMLKDVESPWPPTDYRPGFGIDAALNEIEKNRGIFYDSAVADACLRLFREKGFQIGK